INVCPHEEVEIVTVKQPCVERYTKYVRTRKPGCNGQFKSCSVREPKTVYFHTYKKVNRTRRHTVAECCAGWVHVPGMDGCQRVPRFREPNSIKNLATTSKHLNAEPSAGVSVQPYSQNVANLSDNKSGVPIFELIYLVLWGFKSVKKSELLSGLEAN
ncbi:hypothetical protein TELCIR_08563, partial [Teladorsagia circumcincta]